MYYEMNTGIYTIASRHKDGDTIAFTLTIIKEEVHPIPSHTLNEGLNNMNINARKRFFKSTIYNRNSYVYIWFIGC